MEAEQKKCDKGGEEEEEEKRRACLEKHTGKFSTFESILGVKLDHLHPLFVVNTSQFLKTLTLIDLHNTCCC